MVTQDHGAAFGNDVLDARTCAVILVTVGIAG